MPEAEEDRTAKVVPLAVSVAPRGEAGGFGIGVTLG
jgi:hypothetical protein